MTKKQKAQLILQLLTELYPEPKAELNASNDYEFLFAVIMSAQTTDKQVNKLTDRLFVKYPTLEAFATANLEELAVDMASIGLYRQKAKNLILTAVILINEYEGKVPNSLEAISALHGAGKKTANVVTGDWFGNNQGIAVDTHVMRLANNFGLTKHSEPLKIEEDLKQLFPQDQWSMMSLRLILYGRYHYPARSINHTGPLSHLVSKENNLSKTKKTQKKLSRPFPKLTKSTIKSQKNQSQLSDLGFPKLSPEN
jgi:endonuclease III